MPTLCCRLTNLCTRTYVFFKNKFKKKVTGREAEDTVVHHAYADLMLSPYLKRHRFKERSSAVGVAEPGRFSYIIFNWKFS